MPVCITDDCDGERFTLRERIADDEQEVACRDCARPQFIVAGDTMSAAEYHGEPDTDEPEG